MRKKHKKETRRRRRRRHYRPKGEAATALQSQVGVDLGVQDSLEARDELSARNFLLGTRDCLADLGDALGELVGAKDEGCVGERRILIGGDKMLSYVNQE
jgi:hypothetical protein